MKPQVNLYSDAVKPGFLTQAGEMARLIRTFDWASTPLGPISNWPQSLCTAVSIVVGSKFPMFLWWGPAHICFYNDAYRPSLGTNGKHPGILGQRAEEGWNEIWPIIKPLMDQVLSGGESTWSEDQLIPLYRNGALEDAWWTFSLSPVMDESGQPAGVLSTNFETTQNVLNLRELRLSDQRFQNLIREANVGIVVLIGKEMMVAVVNSAYGQLIERTPAELLGKPLFDVIPDAEEPFRKLLDNVMATGEPLFLYAHPYLVFTNGKKIEGFLDVVYQPYREADGSITGVVALAHNVTERTLSRKKVEEAEAKARMAIESADLGTYEIDLQTDEMKTSERFKIIWGISHATHRSTFVDRIHSDDRELRLEAHREAVQKGQIDYEARVVWEDGSIHWVKVKGKVLYDTLNKPVILVGVIQDITEQKEFADQLTKQVKERTIELQRSNEDLLQFAHVISHDLKEPVRKIKIFTNRMRDELAEEMPEKAAVFLGKIKNASNRMSDMIEGVLNYSSLNASEESLEPVDLNEIIKAIETDLEILIQQKEAVISYGRLPTVWGAPILLYQLLYNLINNSLKFSKREVAPRITLSSVLVQEQGRDWVRLEVADNGIGFDQENAATIFDSFTRLNSKDVFEGTGLGLALCKKIVERHAGTISAVGSLDEGACIIIKLPFVTIPA